MKRHIGFAITNYLGVRSGLFTPNEAFDQIVRDQMSKLAECAEKVRTEFPTTNCSQMIDDITVIMTEANVDATTVADHFPALKDHLKGRTNHFIYSNSLEAIDRVKVSTLSPQTL